MGFEKGSLMDIGFKLARGKSAYDLTDEEVAKSIGHEVEDFNDDGSDIETLRDILEGNYNEDEPFNKK
jgi:hypothetical protein